ncbi:MAG: hypothetical protein RIE56_13395 [Amphiplicatus sp.]
MAFEEFLMRVGLGELVAEDFFLAQILLMSLTALLFAASLVMCVMAFKAATAARRARSEAEAHFLSAKDLAVEMRHLTAQVELATKRPAAKPVRIEIVEPLVDAAANEDQASTPAEDDSERGANFAEEDVAPFDKTLDAAKEAASVPKALVGSFLRRRR